MMMQRRYTGHYFHRVKRKVILSRSWCKAMREIAKEWYPTPPLSEVEQARIKVQQQQATMLAQQSAQYQDQLQNRGGLGMNTIGSLLGQLSPQRQCPCCGRVYSGI